MRVIIVGAGEVGVHVAQVLSREHQEVTLIEAREEVGRRVGMALDVHVKIGNGADPRVLEEAGIAQADMLIALTGRDEVNILSCLMASSLTRLPMKVARVRDQAYEAALAQLKAEPFRIDLCLHPEKETANAAVQLMEIPSGREVAEFAEGRVLLVSTTMAGNSPFLNRRLRDVQAGVASGGKILIAALRRGESLIIPHGGDLILEGDQVFLVAERQRVMEALSSLGKGVETPQRVILYGASKIAQYLASILEEKPFSVRLICSDQALCNRLLGKFKRVAVLCGEGTDQDLLLEFNVQDTDYFVSASEDEEENILACLLAKRLGAQRTMALVSRLSYTSLVSTIGVDVVLNPQMAAVDRILRHVRKGKVLRVATLGGDSAEAIEAVVGHGSELLYRPLKDLSFPQDAIIGAVVRRDGSVVIPHGETVIQEGDRVIIFAKRGAIPHVERFLTAQEELA
ncbi:MAG: Trk system potassium transporter TrkA [bacterium]